MEKRVFHRIMFSADGQLRQGTQVWPATLIDVSLKGALVTRPQDFDADLEQRFLLSFTLEGVSTPIIMEGVVAHEEPGSLGIAAVHMDIDSATVLRRLIELNLGDSDLLQRDLHALVTQSMPIQ